MSTLETPTRWTPTGTAEAVVIPRRHVFAIAILMCVPLPLLSVAATVVPLPQIVERATATFIAIAAPVVGNHGSLLREKPVAVRSVEITYRPAEKAPVATAKPVAVRARSQAPTYVGHARRPSAKVAVQTEAGGTRAGSRDPDSRAIDEPGDAAPPEKADPPARPEPPTDGEPGPGGSADPPAPSPPPGGGGSGGSGSGGSGSGSGGSGGSSGGGGSTGGGSSGSGSSGGGSEPVPPVPPGQGGDPPGGGGGTDKVEPPATDTGSGSPPAPPAPPAPPGSGNGKP